MKSLARITLLLGFFLLPVIFVSQTNDRQDSLIDRAKRLNGSKKFEEARTLLNPTLENARVKSDWDLYFPSVIEIAKSLNGLKKFDTACIFLVREIQFVSQSGKAERPETGSLWNNLAVNYANQEQYLAAFEAYQKAIQIFEKFGVLGSAPAYAYKNIAQTYDRLDNATLAKQCYDAALRVDTGGTFRAEVYSSLANHYHFLGDEAAVMRNYKQGMADPKLDEENKALLQSTGVTAFIAIGHFEEANQMLQSAIKFYEKDRQTWEDNLISCLTLRAEIAIRQQDINSASLYFYRAETEAKKYYSWKSREVAKLYIHIGQFYEDSGQLHKAVNYYQKALVQAFPNFNSKDIKDNPALTEAWLESQAMFAAISKAQVLVKLAEIDKAPESLRMNAAHCFDLALEVAARLRHSYGNDADKIAQSTNNRNAYQSAALNLWALWSQSKDSVYLEHLLSLIEKSKAQSLADALQQQRALALSEIPDSLLKNEVLLRNAAAEASVQSDDDEAGQDSLESAESKQHSLDRNKSYDDFIDQLGKDYPQFLQYSTADIPADISSIRRALPDSTVLLSCFDAGNRYLTLQLHGKEIIATEVAKDSAFNQSLLDFVGLLSDLNRQQASPGDFFHSAHALYQKLFPQDQLQGVKSLLIVPDGLLCYLPFEALLSSPHTNGTYATAPYLFRNCAVSYAWSAKLLTVSKASNVQGGFAQFAPFAESSRDGLAVLENSEQDVPWDLSSSLYKAGEATRDQFLLEAPANQILHLSTHAQVGKDGVPGIEFFDRRLSLPEIYAQRFHASLVSLSACETGSGKFAGGEGVLSLARAFAYAGAQSMVASLWPVNDRATSALFSGFYKNLKVGMSKSEALRQAKLSFLATKESDARKAPYYWAAFTLSGADGPVVMAGIWSGLWKWALLLLILSMAIFWGFRRRRNLNLIID